MLKSNSGWEDYDGRNGNGTDAYGLSVLPAGYHGQGFFSSLGELARFWSVDEEGSDNAYYMGLDYNYEGAYMNGNGYKLHGFSVRCLRY